MAEKTILHILDAQAIGVGLKSQHYQTVLDQSPALAFFEVHAENYMMPGGAHHRYLEAIGGRYALSLHGVGMSLGSPEGLDENHLKRFRTLVDTYKPSLVSEHLAWSRQGGIYLNDLLPLPMNRESLAAVADNVARLQDAIGRAILVENPSAYLAFTNSDMREVEFLTDLVTRTGCGLLLDVNNIYVSACNMGWSAQDYVDAVPEDMVGEIHLAGHLLKDIEGVPLRIDDHGSPVPDAVWDLYGRLLNRIGPRPTLIEWDNNIPAFDRLLAEADKAATMMAQLKAGRADGVCHD